MIRYKPTPRECMLLLLRAIQDAEQRLDKRIRLVRLPRSTLRKLWGRQRLSEDFLADAEEWLLSAGWALVETPTSFAAIKSAAVKNWPRVSANMLSSEIKKVQSGTFDFEGLENQLAAESSDVGDDEDD